MAETAENTGKAEKGKKKARKSWQVGRTVRIRRDQVVEDGYNPRYISPANMDRLKKSIRKNGLVGTLVWNRATGHIVGGHQRLAALDACARTTDYELDVTEVEMPLKDEVRLNVALNNADSQGEFDFAALRDLSIEFGLDASEDFGFSDEAIEINFPEKAEALALDPGTGGNSPGRVADEAEIARMKEAKREAREKLKEQRADLGDYLTEPKGVLTVVFDSETAKADWFRSRDVDDAPSVVHVSELEELLSARKTAEDRPETDAEQSR